MDSGVVARASRPLLPVARVRVAAVARNRGRAATRGRHATAATRTSCGCAAPVASNRGHPEKGAVGLRGGFLSRVVGTPLLGDHPGIHHEPKIHRVPKGRQWYWGSYA